MAYDDDDDVRSIMSSVSHLSTTSDYDEGGLDLETPLLQAISDIEAKRSEARARGLESLADLLSRYVYPEEVLSSRLGDLMDVLRKAAKSADHMAKTFHIITLLHLQPVVEDMEAYYEQLRNRCEDSMLDPSLDTEPRSQMAVTLAIMSFVSELHGDDIEEQMELLSDVFTDDDQEASLIAICIEAWSLLLIKLSSHDACKVAHKLSHFFHRIIGETGTDRNVLFAAARALVLLNDAQLEAHEVPAEGMDDVARVFQAYAKESNKGKSKKDLKEQRLKFRQLLEGIETGRCPSTRLALGHSETVVLDSWSEYMILDNVRAVLRGGMQHHLRHNQVVRDLLGLGPVQLVPQALSREDKANLKAIREDNRLNRQADRRAARSDKWDDGF
ncbi:uncharacterized protein MONBRDRAFT_9124 [Monosiga brevicollis MX1]|uniref:Interferon-related developmental regulator N-terminal domain-containing protein n=1 Tax=Monosiga brevicollis TaxID=81824 RepID=A9V257_MONBE|nr:uncharacterized protein MONBRDRAFT_9124 [Monosiga brevicollis MX1]EDQ88322.1 predicted protein [Monosiga brevicollis MX1]|eukprot:XP_001746915.1 hypothetical protein [Monosiga brevicollis MX1]